MRKGALIGAVVLVIVGVVMGYMGVRDRKFNSVCRMTTGEVNNVTRTTIQTSKGRNKVKYRVNFSYNINGQDYHKTNSLSHDVATGPTQVFYDPAEPDEGVLNKPSPTLDFLMAVVMLVGAGVAAYKGLRGT